MRNTERFTAIVLVVLAAMFGASSLISLNDKRQAQATQLQGEIIRVPITDVVGSNPIYAGESTSPYTLVEFGDYECPPCHALTPSLNELLVEDRGKIKFVFRNFPLTDIHPLAEKAALIAEASRLQGKFWQVHDGFYRSDLDEGLIDTVLREQHLSTVRLFRDMQGPAKTAVQSDTLQAAKLGIKGTPTFILCCPNMRIYKLQHLSEVSELVH